MKLVELLKKKNILKFGEFTLRSGIKSSYYCDVKEALGDPIVSKAIIDELVKIIPPKVTCIAGSGYGGITLAALVASKLKLPLVLVRDRVKDHGTKKVIDGYIPHNKDKVCIVDDVFTTGSSVNDTKDKLIGTKVRFTKSVVVLNRSTKKGIVSLINSKDIMEIYTSAALVS